MDLLTEFLIAFVTFILIPALYYHVKYYRVKKFLKSFPSPPSHPIIGSAREIRKPKDFLEKMHEYTKKYGSLVYVRIGFRDMLVCSNYKFLEFLLSNNKLLKKATNIKFLEPWIGDGLITSDGGPKWRVHRKLITPAFHFKILEQFVDVFESDGNILVEKLSKENGSQSVDIYPYITRCAFDAICETAMGTKVDVQNNIGSSYFESVRDICRIFIIRTTSVLARYNFFFNFMKESKIQEAALKVLHGYTKNMIKKKRQVLQEKQKEGGVYNEVDDLGRKKKKAFLDLILEAKVDNQSLSDEEIREEVDTFMFAGHDTTATSTTFVLYCIANNKDVQDKILEEQEVIFGKEKNPEVTYAHLQEMKYLENVIKEGLRLYTPVPIYGRLIDQDVEFEGRTIPAGVPVLIFSHGIHMNPEYYPNPEKFDPSRFEVVGNKNPFAFIPFSAGPRNCIGQRYAILEMKSLISKVIRNFEIYPAFPRHELDLSPETVLKSLNGVRVGIKQRN